MAVESPLGRRSTVAALLALTAVTGLVDAVSYLELGRVFVANMTGNVVFIGFSLHPHSGLSPLASVVAIAGFLAGALAGGRLATQLSHRAGRWLGVSFGAEAAILLLVATATGTGLLAFDGGQRYGTVVVLAIALGLQNSTVRYFAVPDLTTTVLTLTLTGLAADGSLAGGAGAKPQRRLGSVLAMLGGAAVGAWLLNASPTLVIVVAGVLVAAIGLAFATATSRPARSSASKDRAKGINQRG